MRRKHGIVVWIILTLILTRLHIGLYGQEALTQKERNRLIQKRWSFYLIKDLYNDFLADEIIATIKACYPNEVDSMAAVGLRFVEEQAWDQAYPWFELCFRREPDNIHANYGYSICKRESGKNMAVLGREGDWNTSEKHFRRVITLDSTYQDILYQYALLKLYRKNHLGAIQLAHRQLQANPNTHSGQIGLFRIYYSIIHELKSGEVESLLKARTTLYDRYYLGELHRINEKTEDAEKLFLSVIQQGTSFPLPPVFLSLDRLYVQENQPEKEEKMYLQAV